MSDTKKRKMTEADKYIGTPMSDHSASHSKRRTPSRPSTFKPDNTFIRNQVASSEFLRGKVVDFFESRLCDEQRQQSEKMVYEQNRLLEMIASKHEPRIGDVYMVGNNESNQLGMAKEEGSDSSKFLLCTELVGSEVVHIAVGAQSNFVLTRDGKLFDWGNSDMGALGRRTDMEADPDTERKPIQITGFNPSKTAVVRVPASNEDSAILEVAAGSMHGIALSGNGAVYEWGAYVTDNKPWRAMPPKDHPDNDDTKSELYKGKAPKGFREEARHLYQMPQRVQNIFTGQGMSAAILEDGTLVTWGLDTCGELGRGITKDTRHTFMHADTDEEKNERDEIAMKQYVIPKPVMYSPPISKHNVLNVACGQSHMLVVLRHNDLVESVVYATGLNQYGQLGCGDLTNRDKLELVPDSTGKNIIQVAAGQHHSMFLDMSGEYIYTCGRSDSGQLGITDQVPSAGDMKTSLQLVEFDKDEPDSDKIFKSIAAGEDHSLAVTKTGKLYSWGFGDEGQLGRKNEKYQTRPTLVTTYGIGESVFVMEARGGAQHTLVLAHRAKNN